jgi:hypothetical protein
MDLLVELTVSRLLDIRYCTLSCFVEFNKFEEPLGDGTAQFKVPQL